MTIRQKIEVMEAFERGEEIEACYEGCKHWGVTHTPLWNWQDHDYRIKPKPKLRMMTCWELAGKIIRTKQNTLYFIIPLADKVFQIHGDAELNLVETHEYTDSYFGEKTIWKSVMVEDV